MWDPYAEFQVAKLPNGLTVHAAYWAGRPWEAMGFLIHSGAKQDPVGLEGVAHFVEHLVSDNTSVPKREMRMFFDDCGGTVSLGATDYPYTRYRFFVPADKKVIAGALSMFGHMLFSAKLKNLIERERQVIIGEFNREYPTKLKLDFHERENRALYSGHWLERFVISLGNPESIGRIKQDDLQSFYDMHYTPANMSIVGVGSITLSELVELISESPLAINKKGVRTPLLSPITDITPPSETRYIVEISRHITMAALAKVGSYRSVAKLPGNIKGQTVRIMNEMFDKVLEEEVRERRAWAYYISVSRRNLGQFYTFSINCGSLALEALDSIEEVIEDIIVSMKDREDLFEQVKRRALARNFMIDLTGRDICDIALDDLTDEQRIVPLVECRNDIERVTMDDIRNLLQWLRPEMRWTFITKP